ncbi:hypothetical protein GobsT_11330 [Gemmata obscuriglobus]|nr:hypothetical protein GobsT_11330 [Gemmata obscuriglobus]VTS01471.1 unnamed protein product [Gemmata obscuriglobus UQM 2246]
MSRAGHSRAPRGARHALFTFADHTFSAAARAIERLGVAERTAHLHRHHTMSGASQYSGRCQVQRRVRLAAVRGSGRHAERRASADARGTGATGRSATDSMRRVPAHRGPRPPLHAATSRAPTHGHHAERHRPEPPCPHTPPATPNRTSRRRAAPAPTGTTRSPTRETHHRGPHAQRRRTRPHALGVAEQQAHLHRHASVTFGLRTRWRCQVQRRVRLLEKMMGTVLGTASVTITGAAAELLLRHYAVSGAPIKVRVGHPQLGQPESDSPGGTGQTQQSGRSCGPAGA